MEYVMITGFVFLILLAILAVAYTQTNSFQRDVSASQVQKVGNQIADAANAVYYAGPPAKKTMTLYFPDLISDINVSGQSVTFRMQGQDGPYEYAVAASSNLSGSLRPFQGIHVVSIEAEDGYVNITDG